MKRRGEPDHANGPPRQRQLVANQPAAIPPSMNLDLFVRELVANSDVCQLFARAAVMPESLTQRLTTVDALTYLREVKAMFASQREVYETFLEIMKEFKAQTIDTYGVIQRVKQLFKGNKGLIIGFNTFLPKGFEIRMEDLVREEQQEALTQKQPVEFDQAINYVNKIKDRFRFREGVYKNFLEILNQYRKAQKGIKEVYDQVAYIFRDHEDLLEEFTYFLPDSQAPHRAAMERQRLATVTRDNEQSSRRRGRGEQTGPYDFQKDTSAMFEKIRRRVANSTWNDFLKVLMLFVDGIITEQDLMRLVSCVIGTASNDLVQLFDDFMSRVEDLSFDEDAIDAITKAVTNKTSSHYAAKDKYLRLPISEVIDAARCEKLSVSYVQVPEDYPKLTFSARAKLPDSVKKLPLNDNWVSVTQGSEDYSFQSMRRNQYEDILFRIEDDRYDLELLIERNASVLRKIAQLMERLATVSDDSMQVRFNDEAWSTIQKKHIGQVYGDGAEAMLNSLLNNPQAALPVVRDRLQSKGAEWAKTLAEMEVYWQRQFKQNYTRSLDHRSFYFKVIDKKVLGLRHIVQEIKDAAEATHQAPENTLSMHTSAPASIKLRPDVILEMPDKEVHGDVWALVQIGFVGSEVKPQVEQFWKSIVLPFFRVTDVTSMTPEFGPPSPSATVDADRSAMTTGGTPAVTPAQSAEGSGGAVAGTGTGEQSGASSEAAGEGSAAAVGGSDGAAPTKLDSGNIAQACLDRSAAKADERTAAAVVQDAAGANCAQIRTPDDEEMVDRSEAAPEASEISKLEESDIDDGEEAAGGKGKDRSTVDEDEDEDDAPQAPPVNGLVPSTSVLPLEFEGGKGSSAVEPCPVCAQPQAELAPLMISGEQEPGEILELYCNEGMYGFWRLYHHCYDRLRIARNCILEKHGRNGKEVGSSDGDKSNGAHDGPVLAAGPLDGAQHPGVAGASYEAMRRKFFQLLYGHIVHKSDITAFEDTCRSMLGANSYVLFTIQKLVNKFARHLSGLIADDPSVKLINLHHYEKRRHSQVHWATRLANAAMTHGEDHAIRVVSREDGSVAATWVDFERSDPPPLPCDPDAREFVEKFMQVSESDISARQKARWGPKLYLRRNLHSSMRKGAPPAQRVSRLSQCYVRNGLECKLKQDDGGNSKEPTQTARKGVTNRRFSYKFNFVLDTEDAMLARKPAAERKKVLRRQVDIVNTRHNKFLAVMRARQEQMQQPHHIQHLPQVQRM